MEHEIPEEFEAPLLSASKALGKSPEEIVIEALEIYLKDLQRKKSEK